MESAVIILIVIVICIFGIKSYARRLTQGCCGAGGDAQKRVRVRDKNKEHYPYCVKIGVDGMTCSHCRERVEKALISIGRKELNEMIQEGKSIEMNCHFCNKNYEFTVEELKEILRKCK